MRLTHLSALLIFPLLAGCSGETNSDNKLSQTRMNDIDSLEGTISDDIINTDQVNDEAPTEASAPSSSTPSSVSKKETAKPAPAKKPELPKAAPTEPESSTSQPQE